MRNTLNWKHVTKNRKQYGQYHRDKYDTQFMSVDDVSCYEILATDYDERRNTNEY